MDYDDYVRHIRQKHKAAVACAIIKSRPENLTTNEYIEILRKTITKEPMDIDSISVNSDDFNFDNYDQLHEKTFTLTENIDVENVIKSNYTDVHTIVMAIEENDNGKTMLDVDKAPLNEKPVESTKTQIIQTDKPKKSKFIEETQMEECETQVYDSELKVLRKVKFCNTESTYCDIDNGENTQQAVDSQASDASHISQSQSNRFNILEKHILGLKKRKLNSESKKSLLKSKNVIEIHTNSENFNEFSEKPVKNVRNSVINSDTMPVDRFLNLKEKVSDSNKGLSKGTEIKPPKLQEKVTTGLEKDFSENIHELNFTTSQDFELELTKEMQELQGTQESHKKHDDPCEDSQEFGGQSQELREQIEESQKQTQDEEMDDIYDSVNDVVPFKIVEELNRVKIFLRRKERRNFEGSSESGYHSSSQQWSSYINPVPPTEKWVNQAANTLHQYLTHSPITVTTLDICGEISQVLGELVDKLHNDESYPPFLEAILENIDSYLDHIYEDDPEFSELKKDETTHRLISLTQSVHIISYTIDKITNKLETVFIELASNENVYEISDIDGTKNLAYIFHILEILLQKYMRKKNLIKKKEEVRDTKTSDVWKKWDSSSQSQVKELEKPSFLIKISEILNKIISNCMESYSLVAFAALQCFNIIQVK